MIGARIGLELVACRLPAAVVNDHRHIAREHTIGDAIEELKILDAVGVAPVEDQGPVPVQKDGAINSSPQRHRAKEKTDKDYFGFALVHTKFAASSVLPVPFHLAT